MSSCTLLHRLAARLAIVVLLGFVGSTLSCRRISESSEASAESEAMAAPRPTSSSALPRLRGEHHPVFSLLANRMLAHAVRAGGLAVPLGHPGAAKYLSFNRPWRTWEPNERADDRHVALATRVVSWLVVPLTRAQVRGDAAARTLTMRLELPAAQVVQIKLNDTMLAPVRVAEGWQLLHVDVPAGTLHEGENRIELRWGARGRLGQRDKIYAAVEWLTLAPTARAEEGPVELTRKGALWLPGGGGLAYYVYPYRGAKLLVRVQSAKGPSGCDLVVRAAAEGAEPQLTRLHVAAFEPGKVVETFVDLAPLAERVGRLELLAEGKACEGLTLSDATVVMPGPAPVVKRAAPPKNVIFWLIDNARADRFRVYNPKSRVETPVIDELARTGTVFTRAYIAGTESRVSHACIWTGMYPKQHGFIGPKDKLDLRWVTLPEALQKKGLTTAAWVANGNISKGWGFGEGWTIFHNTLHDGGGLSAEALADHGLHFLEKQGPKPFYLYLGTIDPHVSWRGQQPWLSRYDPAPYTGRYVKTMFGRDWDRLAQHPQTVSERDRRHIIAIYDSTISYNDQQLGRLVEALKQRGLADDTMIVITADHGEELWEYGRIGHGGSLHETVIAVPLIIHYPPLFGKGVRVREGAEVAALMATILDAVGAKVPSTVQLASLLPLAQGVGSGYPRALFASQYELAHTMRLERFKIWVGGKGEPRVFDMGSTAAEAKDVAATHPQATRLLTDALGTFTLYQDRWRQSRWGVANNNLPALPDDLERGGGPSAVAAR